MCHVPLSCAILYIISPRRRSIMYASVWKRFWAFMIDLAVFIVLFILLAQLLNDFTVSLILLVIIWLYYALLESSPWQASLGKRLMGLKVVDKRGRRLTFSKATKRLLVRLVTNVAFYIGFLLRHLINTKKPCMIKSATAWSYPQTASSTPIITKSPPPIMT